ncbi:HYR domain-containing protein [Dactylosporangium sp. CA-052675]|uniref:HYR domain-containing protein n=1 Tax=Dactylosporangium sp. CA-052675 TaxID=3239927 RepID=UPI003D8E229E
MMRRLAAALLAAILAAGLAPSAAGADEITADSAAPVVASLVFDPTVLQSEAGPPNTRVTSHVLDDHSGVASVSLYITLVGPDGATLRFDGGALTPLEGTPLDGVYRGGIGVGYHSPSGWYTVHVVTIDKAGNRLDRTMPEPVGVASKYGDYEAAQISDARVEPAQVTAGSTVTLTARITDDNPLQMPIPATAWVAWRNPGGDITARYEARLVAAGDTYRAAIPIPAAAPNGEYQVFVRAVDVGGNPTVLQLDQQVTVRGGRDHTEFPDVMVVDQPDSVTVSETGGEVRIAAMAGSLTGIREFVASAAHTNADGSTARYEGAFTANSPAAYTARIALPASAPRGTYRMDLRLVDNAGIVMTFALGERLPVVSAPPRPQEPPLVLPDDLTVEAVDAGGTRVAYTASVACTPASGSVFPVGTTTVTCRTDTFRITVADRTPPVLTLPPPVAVDAPSPAGATVRFTATATDTVDGSIPVLCTPAPATRFPVGATTVTCRAVDRAGNTATGTFTVRVRDDVAQLAALRAYVVTLGRSGRRLLPTIDAAAAALTAGRTFQTDLLLAQLRGPARLAGLTAAQREHITQAVERIRRYHRRGV